MKKYFVLQGLLIWALAGLAQITVTNQIFPAPGDTLITRLDQNVDMEISLPGGNQNWDFSALDGRQRRVTPIRPAVEGSAFDQFPSADVVLFLFGTAERYFRIKQDRIEEIGVKATDPIFGLFEFTGKYDPPYIVQNAPVNYLDMGTMNSNLFAPMSFDDLPDTIVNQLPIAPDSIRIRIAITRDDEVDAWGSATLPSGGSFEVLREKRVEYRETRVDAKTAPFPWIDVTNQMKQIFPGGLLDPDTITSYHYLANESKEPIAVFVLDSAGGVDFVEYKPNNLPTDIKWYLQEEFDVSVYPNPSFGNVRFDFVGVKPGEYRLELYNILGTRIWMDEMELDGNSSKKYNLTDLSKGIYLFSLVDNNEITLKSKRLIILKP